MLLDLQILAVDTARVWWRLLPQIMGIYLLGWLGSELALRAAVLAGDYSAWLGLGLFSFSFVAVLVALVLILRLAGRELGSVCCCLLTSGRSTTGTPVSAGCSP